MPKPRIIPKLLKMPGLFRFLSFAWMGLIFFASSLSGSDLAGLPRISDTLTHGAVYFVLAGLLYFSFRCRRGGWAILISSLYGVSDEIHQSFVPGRTPELKDWIVDTIAAFMAVVIIEVLIYLRNSRAPGRTPGPGPGR